MISQNRLLVVTLIFAIVLGAAGATIWSFTNSRRVANFEAEQGRSAKASPPIVTENNEAVITLDAASQQQSGIATVTLESTPYQEQLRAYSVVLDLQQLTDLSNSYANAKAQLRTADAKLNVSQAAFGRAQQLYNGQKDISAAQFQAAEGAFRVDEASRAMAESQLRTVEASARQAWGPVLSQAIVDHSTMVTRLIERRDFLLQVTLPLGESIVTPPTTAFVQLDSGQRYNIQFISPATKTDPRIQGVSFFYIAPAASSLLSGMNVPVLLPSGLRVDGVVIPKTAVVSWQGRTWTYVRTAPETFTRREITTGISTGNGFFQSKGFTAGDQVVVSGAQMLLSEELRPKPQPGEKKAGSGDDDD